MSENWRCQCGEDVSGNYIECWNCQSARPGYSTAAQQAEDYERQSKRTDQQQDEAERQSKRVDNLQDEMEAQNRRADAIMEMSSENQRRFSKLLDRFEAIAEKIEGRLSE